MAVKTHYRKCNICEAMCGIAITHDGEKIIKIRGNPDDNFSRGYHCIKGESLADIYNDPDRIKHPLKRIGSKWTEISWEQAIQETVTGLQKIQKENCNDSVASYMGNPSSHDYGMLFFAAPFLRKLRTKNKYSATSLDQLPHHMVGFHLFGHQMMLPIPDIDRTDYFLILGGNPVVSRGSIMSAPDIKERMLDVQRRGGKITVVDPRKTETAAISDEYVSIKPGTDALFLIGIISTIFNEKLDRPGRLSKFLEGYDDLKNCFNSSSESSTWDLDEISKATTVPVAQITQIAREFSKSKTAVCYGRLGVSAQEFGATCQWLVTVLNIITGNLDSPGGAMFTRPAFDLLKFQSKGRFNHRQTRIRKLPGFSGEFPTSALVEEISGEGKGQIKGLITLAGNPALSAPNSKEMAAAFESLEFMVSIDFYLNETTRHANIILPPVSPLERSNYDIVFNALSIRNTAAFSEALFPKKPNTRQVWEILLDLEARLVGDSPLQKLKNGALRSIRRKLGPEGITRMGIRLGPYERGKSLFGSGLNLKQIKKSVTGVDLGALKSQLPDRLQNKSKLIPILPQIYLSDLERVRGQLLVGKSDGDTTEKFRLIGRRSLRTNNSWSHNCEVLARGKNSSHALMNRSDLQELSIVSGDMISVESRVGKIEIKVVGIDSIKKGVISIPHGYGHNQTGSRLSVASRKPGVNVNEITDHEFIDTLSGNAGLNGIPVEITKASV